MNALRIDRELRTVAVMIGIYCKAHHDSGLDLCDQCRTLWDYTRERVEKCPFRGDKPTCLNCLVHCFKREMREQIRAVMRYAGPRMLWRHPVLAVFHLIDGRRKRGSQRSGPI